ncbi:hypothetical protein CK500_01150 [Halorubrum salipaludis]|uniref:Envelope protein N-terminal domain-containing protein n=1 Tax=Halorubrum salipaludis TaxID=2032630 RepID=A0A2A2FL76_9EURY|nr:hypothetical protein [Halorubrum salipaludis]PAU85305.1 hypothetical protein CK500_01150 [Halorubrum salipaludis]
MYGFSMLAPEATDYDSVDEGESWSTSEVDAINAKNWVPIYKDLLDRRSTLIDEVSSMVDSYFQPAQDGEVDLQEMVGPKHLTDTASTASDYQEAAMALRGMGYPMSEQVVTFTIPADNDDGELELTGRLSWTAHQGNTLAVGQTHFAENIPGSIFAAVNLPDGVDDLDGNTTNTTDDGSTDTGPGADIFELSDEFTIVSAEGADGVSFNDRSLASADTSAEEIEQIFTENYEANKEATENVHDTATDGGGGGWSGLSTEGKAIIVAVLGLLGLGAVNN